MPKLYFGLEDHQSEEEFREDLTDNINSYFDNLHHIFSFSMQILVEDNNNLNQSVLSVSKKKSWDLFIKYHKQYIDFLREHQRMLENGNIDIDSLEDFEIRLYDFLLMISDFTRRTIRDFNRHSDNPNYTFEDG